MNILFIGNSFTYFHDMPKLLMQMGQQAGKELYTEQVTKGGYRLAQHCDWDTEDGQRTLGALNSRKWDYVVLQEWSFGPVGEPERFREAAAELCRKIRALGATPVFYQTWSYKEGSQKLGNTGVSYDAMHDTLKERYEAVAAEHGQRPVAVGDVFYALDDPRGPLALICPDHFHPSLLGSYAIAASFYHWRYGEEAQWLPEGVSSEDAALIWESVRRNISRT